MHQVIAPRGALLEKQQGHRTTGRIVGVAPASGHLDAPGRGLHGQRFFPSRRVLFSTVDGEDIVAFAGDDDLGKAQVVELLTQGLGDKPRVQGQRNAGDLDVVAGTCRFALGEPGDELAGFIGIVTPLFRAKQEMDRQRNLMDGEDNAKQILTVHHLLTASALPTPGTAQQRAQPINDTVGNREGASRSGASGRTLGEHSSELFGRLFDHKAQEHGLEMVQTPIFEMARERLMGDIQKIGELLGIVEAKEMGEGEDHDDLESDGMRFSELVLKDNEKPGKFCVPHGMPSDDGKICIFIEGNPQGFQNQRLRETTELSGRFFSADLSNYYSPKYLWSIYSKTRAVHITSPSDSPAANEKQRSTHITFFRPSTVARMECLRAKIAGGARS
jgi:hypothetical protein